MVSSFRFSFMLCPHKWAGAFLLIALSSLIYPAFQWLTAERREVGAVSRSVDKQGNQTRAWLRSNVLPVLQKTEQDADSRAKELTGAIRTTLEDVSGPRGRLATLESNVSEIGQGVTGVLDKRLGELYQPVEKLVSNLQPTVDQVNQASKELPDLIRDGRFLMARAARTAGHVEQAADKIEAAVPAIVATVDQVGQNVDKATATSAAAAEQSRIFLMHLAEATKPLPSWARIGLAVAPPMVQTGFTVAEWRAIKGK